MPNGDESHRYSDADLSGARWEGGIEKEVNALKEWVMDLDKKRDEDVKSMTAMKVSIAQLKTQVGAWSAVGGLLGAGIVSALIRLLGGH